MPKKKSVKVKRVNISVWVESGIVQEIRSDSHEVDVVVVDADSQDESFDKVTKLAKHDKVAFGVW